MILKVVQPVWQSLGALWRARGFKDFPRSLYSVHLSPPQSQPSVLQMGSLRLQTSEPFSHGNMILDGFGARIWNRIQVFRYYASLYKHKLAIICWTKYCHDLSKVWTRNFCFRLCVLHDTKLPLKQYLLVMLSLPMMELNKK